MARVEVIKELWAFMKLRKRYWLLPMLLIFAILGLLIIFAETSVVAPFIYTLF